MPELINSMNIAASGLKAQSERLKVISQNIANADSASETAGGNPYQRKTITFKNVMDKQDGVEKVKVSKIGTDKSAFRKVYDPNHPGADGKGYVIMPNVDPMIEMMDMREAQRSYEANLSVIDVSKSMLSATIGMLR